jgi:hypothetical protein
VTVQAIYDAESIAVLVRWHDMSAEKAGKNGPSLPVPAAEEEAPAAASPGATGGDAQNPFGDAQVAPAPGGQKPAPQQPVDPFAQEQAPAAPPSEFSDAVAVQIPSQVPAGARKPYFIFGDGQNSVDLWFFDLARPEPIQFTGKGSTDITANDTGELSGVASYDQGEWSVIFKRPLQPASGARLSPAEFMPIAFSVWDGLSRERGNRRGLTLWYSLYLEPELVPSAVGPMVKTGLTILALELIVIALVRSRYRSREQRQQPATTV